MERTPLTATGTVVELDWDEDGQAIAWGLETDRDTYEIGESPKADELVDYVGSRVRVSGWIAEGGESDLPVLEVDTYEILGEVEVDDLDAEDEDEDEFLDSDLDD